MRGHLIAGLLALTIMLLSGGAGVISGRSTVPDISGDPFLSGLEWPVAMDFAPDGRVFFGELLTGRVRIISGGSLLETPFYSFQDAVFFGERGLLGLALHPAFGTNPWVYTYYTYHNATEGRDYNRIARIRANGDIGEFHEVILDRIPGAEYHNGGVIGFGHDGMLFALAGDVGDPAGAQNLTQRSGKVLRMTPDGAVPPDNPFAGNVSADPYVYTFGHRNMFGLAFHPMTGYAYATENGPFCNDEVNLLVAGANYGWGPNWTCETPPEPPANTNQDGPEPIFPIFWSGPVVAPTNAVVYSGGMFPSWEGDLIMGEWNTGSLRRLNLAPPSYDSVIGQEVIHVAPSRILDVELGPDGALWFTTSESIFRLAAPVAAFTATSGYPFANVEVIAFDASESTDSDGSIVSYDWDFGDGVQARGDAVAHIYMSEGTYRVTLTVTDDDGFVGTAVSGVIVRRPGPPAAPIVGSVTSVMFRETHTLEWSGFSNSSRTIFASEHDPPVEVACQRKGTLVRYA